MEFSITVRDADGGRNLELAGDLDLAARDPYMDAVGAALAAGVRTLLVDLSGLSFIDSTGIGALVRARHAAEQNDVGYAVVNARGRVADVLALAGVAEYLAGGAG